MKFLCGRPGCGKESTATLQIDAPSSTVSLVDPRISRDGVPLCGRHADSTTPPMGWTMNDLRSRNRTLAAVPDEDSTITSTPPRVRPDGDDQPIETGVAPIEADQRTSTTMSRRQSIAERARRAEAAAVDAAEISATNEHRFKNSRPARHSNGAGQEHERPEPAGRPERRTNGENAENAPAASAANGGAEVANGEAEVDGGGAEVDGGPASRPARRREGGDGQPDEDKFPWHFQFEDDAPEELLASSPLLSRAFRSIG